MKEQKLPHDHGHNNNEELIRKHLPGEAEIAGVSPAGCVSSGFCATAKNAYSILLLL